MSTGQQIQMSKGDEGKTFYIFPDGSFRTLTESGWSQITEDFADKFLQLIKEGWKEN